MINKNLVKTFNKQFILYQNNFDSENLDWLLHFEIHMEPTWFDALIHINNYYHELIENL